jgi:hypothetical protein
MVTIQYVHEVNCMNVCPLNIGETSSEIFLVSKTLTEETNSGDIFVTIKDHEIVEMHAINGEVRNMKLECSVDCINHCNYLF